MPPAARELPLPSPPFPAGSSPLLVPGFLTAAECRRIVARAERCGFQAPSADYPPSYRSNDRLVLDDPVMAAWLMERLLRYLPPVLWLDGRPWRPCGLNERLRFCRYRPGQSFGVHRDGVHYRDERRSLLTFMVYLNGAADFAGGSTRFFAKRGAPADSMVEIAPVAGTLMLFRHDLWHDGEGVRGGVKYVLRSDVLYRCPSAAAERERPRGYLWNVVAAGAARLATGSRDPSILIWSVGGGREAPVARLRGHSHSVTALLAAPRGVLWSGSRDRTVRRWRLDRRRGRCDRTLHGHRGVVLSLAAHAGVLASGAADGTIRSWTHDGSPLGVLETGAGWVWALAATGRGQFASGTEDGGVRVWDLARSRLVCEIGRTGSPVRALVRLAGGGLASGHGDGVIRIWRPTQRAPATGWVLEAELTGHEADVRALATVSGGRLASGSEDGTVRLWSPGSSSVVLGSHSDFVTGVTPFRQRSLASTSYDGTLRLWDLPGATSP
jgi:hypothetical protein